MRPHRLIFATLFVLSIQSLCAQMQTTGICTVCQVKNHIKASRDGDRFYLNIDTNRIEVGKRLKPETASKKYREVLSQRLPKLWDGLSASAYTNYLNRAVLDAVATVFEPSNPSPELIDSIQLSASTYVGLVKDTSGNFLISVYKSDTTDDVFIYSDTGYYFNLIEFGTDTSLVKALPAILFLKNKVAGIKYPDLTLPEETQNLDTLTQVFKDGGSEKTKIIVKKYLAQEIRLAAIVGPAYKRHLLARQDYIKTIRQKLNPGCIGCSLSKNEALLVYDHECQKFLYKPFGSDDLRELDDLNKINVRYKRPLRIKVVNFNRYIYNLNLASSDISLTSQESALMQQYLLPGSTNGQINPTNTYTNSGSSNGADFVFANISFFKANVDFILEKIKEITLPDISTGIVTNIKTAAYLLDTVKQKSLYHSIMTNLEKLNRQPNADDMYKENATATDFLHALNLVRDSISVIKRAPKLIQDHINNFKDSVDKFNAQTKYLDEAKLLQEYFYSLRRYCDAFIENRITAYSLCTDDFPCCQTPLQTYDQFEDHLNKVSNQIFFFKLARTNYTNLLAAQKAKADKKSAADEKAKADKKAAADKKAKAAATHPPTKSTNQKTSKSNKAGQTPDSTKTKDSINRQMAADSDSVEQTKSDSIEKDTTSSIFLDISSSDLTITNNRITGITLHQLPDTTKSKKAADTSSIPDPTYAIDTLWYNFEKTIPTDYIMRQIIFRNNMIQSNISYTSPPIFPYGDRLGLVIQMPVADTVKRMGTMPASTSTFSVDIPVFGKPLFSFSAGSFVGFGVRAPTYEWQQVPTPGSNIIQPTSPYKLAPTGPGTLPAGLDGMANITWRPGWFRGWWRGFSNNVWLGLSGGVGVVVDQPTVRLGYLLGGTASIGTYQQFHITAGGMAMNINVLKDDLNTSQIYQSQPSIQQYNQKLQLGFFVSISYTVFAPKSTGTMQNQVINAN
jgi:hypothetical protein